jgi:transcriptional regulator with XRE-family HTH domain
MDDRWVRLGHALAADRKAHNLTQEDIASLAGLSIATVQGIERGTKVKDPTPSMRVYASTLGWASGSIEAVLDGGEPTPVPLPAEAAGPTAEGLPLRVARALSEGTTLDTTIVPLSPGAEMVVVVKGKPTATPAEIRAALLEWERREGHLDRLGLVADDSSDSG